METKGRPQGLCVDDEPNILEGLKLVSDMRMPGMA